MLYAVGGPVVEHVVADRVSCGCEAGREDAVPTGADAGTWFDFGERAAG